MGIDIYARWRGQSAAEVEQQYTGFAVDHGHVGYLREAYHGAPYATRALLPEAFAETLILAYPAGVPIEAGKMRARLAAVLDVARERECTIYGHDEHHRETRAVLASIEAFVRLCEEKEAATGEPCRIVASF